MRCLGLGLGDAVPDANTIWTFRERLTESGAIKVLFERVDALLCEPGYLAMSGQLVDAPIVAASKQRNHAGGTAAIKAGRIPQAWWGKPAKLRRKDRYARWTVKYAKAKVREGGTPQMLSRSEAYEPHRLATADPSRPGRQRNCGG